MGSPYLFAHPVCRLRRHLQSDGRPRASSQQGVDKSDPEGLRSSLLGNGRLQGGAGGVRSVRVVNGHGQGGQDGGEVTEHKYRVIGGRKPEGTRREDGDFSHLHLRLEEELNLDLLSSMISDQSPGGTVATHMGTPGVQTVAAADFLTCVRAGCAYLPASPFVSPLLISPPPKTLTASAPLRNHWVQGEGRPIVCSTVLALRGPLRRCGVPCPCRPTPLCPAPLCIHTRLRSPSKTALSLLKCIVGAGSFILPAAVRDAGLLAGFLSLLALGAACAYTVKQLAEAGRIVAKANPHRRAPSYVDVGKAILGDWTKYFIYPGVILTLLGVCAVYLDLIGAAGGSPRELRIPLRPFPPPPLWFVYAA
jgi:hypothetical protein